MSDEGAPPVPGWPEESAQRLQKARAIRELGHATYPTRFERSHGLGEIVAAHGGRTLEELEALGASVRVAGRVLTKRGHGKASFATVGDGESTLQLYVRQDAVGEDGYKLFDLLDLGDFVGVEGTVMRTRKGELSVQARTLTLLSKALLPPPEKWHGLTDVEARYRQRYLDLIANPEVRRAFLARSAMVAAMRRFLDEQGIRLNQVLEDVVHQHGVEFSRIEWQRAGDHQVRLDTARLAERHGMRIDVYADGVLAIDKHVSDAAAQIERPTDEAPRQPRIQPVLSIDRTEPAASPQILKIVVLGCHFWLEPRPCTPRIIRYAMSRHMAQAPTYLSMILG
jgi:hypothetical protein